MTRIDEAHEAESTEGRQLGEQRRAEQRRATIEFQAVVAERHEKARRTVERRTDDERRARSRDRNDAERSAVAALLARRGIQSRALAAVIEERGKRTVAAGHTDRAVAEARRDGRGRDREVAREADAADDGRTARLERESPTPDETSQERGAAGDGHGPADTGGRGAMGAGGDGRPVLAQPAPSPREEASAPRGPRISRELIERLVSRVFTGVTPEGDSQLTIELEGDLLAGSRLDVVSHDREITCTFHTADESIGRLLKASEGALTRALARKGLSLACLEVVER